MDLGSETKADGHSAFDSGACAVCRVRLVNRRCGGRFLARKARGRDKEIPAVGADMNFWVLCASRGTRAQPAFNIRAGIDLVLERKSAVGVDFVRVAGYFF